MANSGYIPPKGPGIFGPDRGVVRLVLDSNHKAQAIKAILNERDFQDAKWGPIEAGGGHTLGEWILLLEAELDEAKKALIKGGTGRNSIRSEITQIAAVALSALEQHGVTDTDEGRAI